MKKRIVIGSSDIEFFNNINKCLEELHLSEEYEILNAKVEIALENFINGNVGDVYLLYTEDEYYLKHMLNIHKNDILKPVFTFGEKIEKNSLMHFIITHDYSYKNISYLLLKNMHEYLKNTIIIPDKKLNNSDPIKFEETWEYNPITRFLYNNEKYVDKLTPKESAIFELLVNNYGNVVEKKLILEKGWKKTDIYSAKSMEVYISNLKKKIFALGIKSTINSITGVGLVFNKVI